MGEEIKKEHKIACCFCQHRENLIMVAHRKDGYIVGWLFVYTADFEKIKGRDLNIEIK